MKDSKEDRISNLKNMINHVNDEEKSVPQKDEYEEIEEDEELINFLNESTDEFEIDDEYIYRPGKNDSNAINLDDDAKIDENFIIETNINEKLDENTEIINNHIDFNEEISENFDNLINIQIAEKPVLAIISLILGIIFIIFSIIVFNSGTERIIDNVVSGENHFIMVVLLIIGALLIIYAIFKIFNINSPFDSMIESIDDIEEDTPKAEEKKEERIIPKSNIPLDKESYKIGEFDMDELKDNLKKSFSKSTDKKKPSPKNNDKEEINVEDLPPAREKSADKKGLIKEEIEEKDYEQAKLEGETIDEIFADVDDLPDENE